MAFDTVMVLVENNGNKKYVDDMEIEFESIKTIKNEKGKEIEYINNINKRKILTHPI